MKSPPELWAEISDPEALAKHLSEFGEIRITKLEPEHTVAWEGDLASGIAKIEASGWGTKVVLKAEIAEEKAPEPRPQVADRSAQSPVPSPQTPDPEPEPEPEPEPSVDIRPEADEERMSLLARLFGVRRKAPEAEPLPVLEANLVRVEPSRPEPAVWEQDTVAFEPVFDEPDPEPDEAVSPEVPALDPDRARAVLDGTLDALGAAHHRPFSRA